MSTRVRSELRIATQAYESQKQGVASTKLRRSSTTGVQKKEKKNVEAEAHASLTILADRLRMETEKNQAVWDEVQSPRVHEEVKYGVPIQLLHIQSGEWLSCHKGAAPRDRECRQVSLKAQEFLQQELSGGPWDEEDEDISHFKLMPRFKAQSIGSTV